MRGARYAPLGEAAAEPRVDERAEDGSGEGLLAELCRAYAGRSARRWRDVGIWQRRRLGWPISRLAVVEDLGERRIEEIVRDVQRALAGCYGRRLAAEPTGFVERELFAASAN